MAAMHSLLGRLLRRNYYPLNKILVSKSALEHNFNYISNINPEIKIAPVLKSNAYGHGIEIVGRVLDEVGAPFFCVDSLYEAYQLKKAGVKTPILIMGYIDPKSLPGRQLPFSYAIYDLKLAQAINDYQPGSQVHIFVDTGMHREGVSLEDLPKFIKSIKELESLKVIGLMTHLAIGGESKNPLTIRQLKNFNLAVKMCEKAGLELKWRHIGGSNGILYNKLEDINVVRVGLGVYGIDPMDKNTHLKPVLKMITKIVQIKQISKGERTGYNAKFRAKKNMTIGILPIGYNEGVDRRLSNKGVVLVGSMECPIIGMLSMNMTTIDLSGVKNLPARPAGGPAGRQVPQVGQEVVVFSDNPKDINSIENTAKLCQTTPYVILVNLAPSTRREII